MILPQVVARQSAFSHNLLMAQNQPYALGRHQFDSYGSSVEALDPQGPARAFVLAMLGCLCSGVFAAASVVRQLPRLCSDSLVVLRSARRPGPITKAVLAPLFVGATPLLPVLALIVGAADGFYFAGNTAYHQGADQATRGLRARLASFAANQRATLRSAVESTLEDPNRLGLGI
jgi:hypothetical protein